MTSVSVVIPTIGRVDRLKRALQSVASQTKTPEEVIIVSEGNSNRLADVTESFDFLTNIIEQKGEGLSNARNEGIKESSGSLIAFLDDDDWWKPEKIKHQVRVIHNTDTAFVFTGIEHIDQNGSIINYRIPTKRPDKQAILTQNAVGAPSTVLVKRSCINAVGGFDEDLPSREEWDLYIRLLGKFNCEYISEPLVIKESHDNTMSRDIDLIERDWIALQKKHEQKYDEHTKRIFYSNYHFELGRVSCKEGDLRKGRYHYKKSIKYARNPLRLAHYVSTFFGRQNYDVFTEVYRDFRKRWTHLKYGETVDTVSTNEYSS